MPLKTSHARINALGPERIAQVDSMLIKKRSTLEVARMIQEEWGLYQDVARPTLAKELRRYRMEKIALPLAAKAKAIEKAKDPRIQKRLLDKVEEYDVHANWLKLIQAQEKRVGAWLSSPMGPMPSATILNDIRTLNEMYGKYSTFLMERGLLPRAAKNLNLAIRAETIVIDDTNVAAVTQALQNYLSANPAEDFAGVIQGTVDAALLRQVQTDIAGLLAAPAEDVEDAEFVDVHVR